MRVDKLFDLNARKAIEETVKEAELRTSGEIVPMVVPSSGEYTGVRAAAAALLAFSAGIVLLVFPVDPVRWLPPLQVATFVVGYWLSGRRWLLRHLVPKRVQAPAVAEGARLAFLEQGLVETRDRTGILIYISLLERRVEVLADRGIDQHVAEGTWDGVVESILTGIREQRAEEGLVEAIRACGEILAARFPPRADDTNELANKLRT
jgi:putative membrane protein